MQVPRCRISWLYQRPKLNVGAAISKELSTNCEAWVRIHNILNEQVFRAPENPHWRASLPMQAVPDQLFSEGKFGQAHWNDSCRPRQVWVPPLQQILHKEVQLAGSPKKRRNEAPKPDRSLHLWRLGSEERVWNKNLENSIVVDNLRFSKLASEQASYRSHISKYIH